MVRNKHILRVQLVSYLEIDGVNSMEKLTAEKCVELDLPAYTRDYLADAVEPFVTANLPGAWDFLDAISPKEEE